MNHLASSVVDIQGRRGVAILNSCCGFCGVLTIRIEGRTLVRAGEIGGQAKLVEVGCRCSKSSPMELASVGLYKVHRDITGLCLITQFS